MGVTPTKRGHIMAADYNHYTHTHVTVNHPKAKPEDDRWLNEAWDGTFGIILHTGDRVWVPGHYCHLGHPDVIQVGDGTCKGYDQDGNCILSVPASWCKFYTPEEAECIERCIDTDQQLLEYAR